MTSSSRRIDGARRSPFRTRLTMTIGATVFLSLVGTAGASALWTAPAVGISGSVASDTVGIQLSLDKPLAVTYNATTATTSSRLTVTNTGGATVPYTVTVPADSSALAQAIVVNAWPATRTTNCTSTAPLPAAAVTGTWASFPVVSGASLASGASAYWCVRTTLARVVTATNGLSVSAAVTATGALPGTNWTSSVVSAAAAQNTQDTETPTVPTGLAASATTSTGTTLTWTASTDNVGVAAYDVYRVVSGVETLVATATAPTVTAPITGLTGSTAYSFVVKAKDAAGNVSAASSAVAVTTPAAPVWWKISTTTTGGGNATYCADGDMTTLTVPDNTTSVILYSCKTTDNDNQRWQMANTTTVAGVTYFNLVAKYAPSFMWQASTTQGSSVVTLNNGAATTATRQWSQVAVSGSPTVFQIKNRSSGQCVSRTNNPANLVQLQLQNCNSNSATQRFTFTEGN